MLSCLGTLYSFNLISEIFTICALSMLRKLFLLLYLTFDFLKAFLFLWREYRTKLQYPYFQKYIYLLSSIHVL